MGVFKKKPDPISERARELNDKIAALEAEIKRLSRQPASPAGARPEIRPPAQAPSEPHSPALPSESPAPDSPPANPPDPLPLPPSPPAPTAPQPRLRSTALPHGPTITPTPAPQEPIFEQLDQSRLQRETKEKQAAPDLTGNLGMRKNGLSAFLQRLKSHFRGPVTSNPRLVNYLAAGSIQGLRPLRYEKRVARNRFILLAGLLILLLWGIVYILLKNK